MARRDDVEGLREYHREYTRKYRDLHRERLNARRRELYNKPENAARNRENMLYWKYGLDYDGLGSPCSICGNPAKEADHDHSTGTFRGWLCCRCNRAIGQFEDSPVLLEKAAEYLRSCEGRLRSTADGRVA